MPKLPSSANVPKVSQQISVPQGAFTSDVSIAAQELAPAADTYTNIAIKQQNRRNTIDRAKRINQYSQEADGELRRLNAESDLSDESTLQEFGGFLATKRQEILQDHIGTEESRGSLTLRLQDIESQVTGRAAGISAKLGRDAVLKTFNDGLTALGESASSDPSLENLNRLLSVETVTMVNDVSGAFDPSEEQGLTDAAQDLIVSRATDKLIIQGRVEEAESLLIDGGMNRFLSPEKQRVISQRIETVYKARKDIATQAATAKAVESAKLEARRENISLILQDMPSLTPGDNVVDSPAVTSPFGVGQEASADIQDATRMFTASRRLLLGGETQIASGLLSQARFIMENSPEIQREKELDKPISEDLASELGVPIGTSLRSVMSIIPRSPEDVVRSKSAASARGKEQIKGEEGIAFIDEANIIVTDLLDELELDPTLVGVSGGLRATGQTALGVIGDLGANKIVDIAKDLVFEDSALGMEEIDSMFGSPTLSVLSIMENSIGMILARLRSPTGRIPVDVIKRSIADVNLTGLKSAKQVKTRLKFIQKQLNQRSGAIKKRFGLQEDEESTIGIPKFKVINGVLTPVGGE